jgi:hypothetical protein
LGNLQECASIDEKETQTELFGDFKASTSTLQSLRIFKSLYEPGMAWKDWKKAIQICKGTEKVIHGLNNFDSEHREKVFRRNSVE